MSTLKISFGPNNSYELFIPEGIVTKEQIAIDVISPADAQQKQFEWPEIASEPAAK